MSKRTKTKENAISFFIRLAVCTVPIYIAFLGDYIKTNFLSNVLWGVIIMIFYDAIPLLFVKYFKKTLNKIYKKYANKSLNSEVIPNIEFKGYDYFDHSGGRYIDKMIKVSIDDSPISNYNFELSIEENIEQLPKLKGISIFVKNYLKEDLAKILKNDFQLIINAKSTDNLNTFAVKELIRGRLDDNDNLETAVLQIVLTRTDKRTVCLIDSIYHLLKERYELEMTSLFKKISFKSPKTNKNITLNDLLIFATEFNLIGFAIQVCDKVYNVGNSKLPQQCSYNIQIPYNIEQKFLYGNDLSEIIKKEKNYKEMDITYFTDVCISYNIGMHIELLSYTELCELSDIKTSFPTSSEKLQKYVRNLYKRKHNLFTDKDAHYIHYLKNIYRKIDREYNIR